MIRTPKPGSDLHAALCAIVRHPDALDSAELAAILWGRPKLAPLPPPAAAMWATDDGGPRVTRRDLRHLLQWRGVDPADRAELLAMSEDGLRAMVAGTVHGPNALARAIGASLVLSRGKEWLTQSGGEG